MYLPCQQQGNNSKKCFMKLGTLTLHIGKYTPFFCSITQAMMQILRTQTKDWTLFKTQACIEISGKKE